MTNVEKLIKNIYEGRRERIIHEARALDEKIVTRVPLKTLHPAQQRRLVEFAKLQKRLKQLETQITADGYKTPDRNSCVCDDEGDPIEEKEVQIRYQVVQTKRDEIAKQKTHRLHRLDTLRYEYNINAAVDVLGKSTVAAKKLIAEFSRLIAEI